MRPSIAASCCCLATLVGCGTEPETRFTPQSFDAELVAITECLSAELAVCLDEPVRLDDCTAFEWDSVIALSSDDWGQLLSRYPRDVFLSEESFKGPDTLRVVLAKWYELENWKSGALRPPGGWGDAWVFFVEDDQLVRAYNFGRGDRLSSYLGIVNGVEFNPGDAFFKRLGRSTNHPWGSLRPFYEPTQEEVDSLRVWAVAKVAESNEFAPALCLRGSLDRLLGPIRETTGVNPTSGMVPRIVPISSCMLADGGLNKLNKIYTVTDSGERASAISVSVPEFFSASKAKICVGKYNTSLSAITYCSSVRSEGEEWETEFSYTVSVS